MTPSGMNLARSKALEKVKAKERDVAPGIGPEKVVAKARAKASFVTGPARVKVRSSEVNLARASTKNLLGTNTTLRHTLPTTTPIGLTSGVTKNTFLQILHHQYLA